MSVEGDRENAPGDRVWRKRGEGGPEAVLQGVPSRSGPGEGLTPGRRSRQVAARRPARLLTRAAIAPQSPPARNEPTLWSSPAAAEGRRRRQAGRTLAREPSLPDRLPVRQ